MRTPAEAFNEWMRRFAAEPERFEHEWQTVERFLRQARDGVTPTYGETAAAYFTQLRQC